MYIYDFYYITPHQSNKEITKYIISKNTRNMIA